MLRRIVVTLCLIALLALLPTPATAFQGAKSDGDKSADGAKNRQNKDGEAEDVRPLPTDRKLLALHREFVKKAELLAAEYEKKKEWGKARDVYGEILKLVPKYPPALEKYRTLFAHEANAQTRVVDIEATKGWQDSGIIVIPGKPIRIRAAGSWVFTLSVEINPNGIKIPQELRDYNLGCLLGAIDTGNPKEDKPFVIGAEKAFEPEKPGRLLLRMYDIDPSDNEGQLKVEIRGTFEDRNRD